MAPTVPSAARGGGANHAVVCWDRQPSLPGAGAALARPVGHYTVLTNS